MSTISANQLSKDAIVVVGKLGRPYGVRGWQALHSFTEPAENLFSYSPWFLQISTDAAWVEVNDCDSKPHKEAYIARINGTQDRDEAQRLTGALVGVRREAIPEPDNDEFFWHDLIDSRVTNQQGENLGVVREMMETAAHALLCINCDDAERTILVPFTSEYIQSVDAKAKQLVVNWQLEWS